ncbi:MAG: hypothetical protein QMC85_03700 [Methanocellales archaeon]|nr:hypothetical protein [Methanocellales archaeon]
MASLAGTTYFMYKTFSMDRELLRATMFNRPHAFLNAGKSLMIMVVLLLLSNLTYLLFYHHLALQEMGMLITDLAWLVLSMAILFIFYRFWKEIMH